MRPRKKETAPIAWNRVRDVWGAATVADWLTLLQRIAPNQKWSRSGQTITGLCPYHNEGSPSLKLQFNKRLGKCFGCQKTVTDIVQLVAKLQGSSYLSALLFLNTELHLEGIFGNEAAKFAEIHDHEEMKKAAAVAFGKLAEEFVRDHPAHLDYMRIGAAYLEKARNVPMYMVPELPVAIFGKPEHVKKYMPEEYHASYDKFFKVPNDRKMWGDIIFWYNDSPATISNFKIRNKAKEAFVLIGPDRRVEDLDPVVIRSLFSKDFFIVREDTKRLLGVYGLHHYSRLISDHNTTAIITEGEFDALSVMVAQRKSGQTLDFPVFAGGGGGGRDFSFLRDSWYRTIYIVTDAPGDKKGTEIAYSWLCSPDNHRGDSTNPPLQYCVFTWPAEMTAVAGDLDEAVQALGYDYIREQVWIHAEDNYLNQMSWAEQQCDYELAKINAKYDSDIESAKAAGKDNAIANISEERVRQIQLVISHWLKAISAKVDKALFVSTYSNKTGIDLSVDDAVYTDVHDINTMDGASRVVYDAFNDVVSIPYYEGRAGVNVYCVFSRTNETSSMLSLNSDKAIQTAVTLCVGRDMVSWMKKLLRNAVTVTPPASEADKYANNPAALRAEETKRCLTVMQMVLYMFAANCVDKGTLTRVGQGIHYKDVPGNNHVYVVNGTRVYKGTYNSESGAQIEWERVKDIRDGKYYFALNNKERWSETVSDVQDLYYGMQVDLHKTFNDIADIVDSWLFENHDVMRLYIAAWIMSLPIQLATKRVNVTFITGESTSGKTSFAQGLLGGLNSAGHEIPSILEPAKVTTNASEAYVYQAMDGSSELLNIDEAETDDNNIHNMRMETIFKMLYAVPTGGAKIGRGSAAGTDVVEYTLQSPVLCAGIHLPTNEVFLTRVVVLYTKKDYTRRNIADLIVEKFNDQQLHDLRKSITTGLLGYIPQIINRRRELDSILSKVKTTPPVSSRFVSAVSTVLTVYEMCGTPEDPHDPVELYKKVVESNKTRLETVYAADAKSELLDTVLFAKCIQSVSGSSNITEKVSPRDLLVEGTMDDINILNNSNCGVYCMPSQGWLIFYWRQIKTAILSLTYSPYRNAKDSALREAISKNKYVVHDIDQITHQQIVDELNLVDAKNQAAYSVVRMAYLRETPVSEKVVDVQARQGAMPPEPPMSCYESDPAVLSGVDTKSYFSRGRGSEDNDMDFDI